DFDPNTMMVSDDQLDDIDRWALMRLTQLTKDVRTSYEAYSFHEALHAIHNFCVIDMSTFYLDVLKDRLYVEEKDGVLRRAAQSTIYRILNALTRMLSPILAFTAEEIWGFLPHMADEDARAVVFNEIPKAEEMFPVDDEFMAFWDRIHAIRDDVKKALEIARTDKLIGGSLDARLTLYASGDTAAFLEKAFPVLADVFIVSQLRIETEGQGNFTGDIEGLSITVDRAEGHKCCRCWKYEDASTEHPDLCKRCAALMSR
ncbi:MAG: class I tRNA ligase family protein, partial [Clostridia bacterium]|nr:class I tRNA ligase family protein [Clostridia bacterium]